MNVVISFKDKLPSPQFESDHNPKLKVALALVKTLVLVTLTLIRSYPSLSQKLSLH